MMPNMMKTELIPAFDDNYIFLLTLNDGSIAVVDPGDATPVIEALSQSGAKLDYIFLTHHHDDHIGGVKTLVEKYDAQVIGHEKDMVRLPTLNISVNDGDQITIGGHKITVMDTSGHTIGHICYHFADDKTVFVGDTLFVMGCGRLFEGTAEQMFESLQKLSDLPNDTSVYCAHEYTLANAEFALSAFPDNDDVKSARLFAQDLRNENKSTVPTTIRAEKDSNPFLLAKTAEEFAELRKAKDRF